MEAFVVVARGGQHGGAFVVSGLGGGGCGAARGLIETA